jgi:hypothetical protein
MQQETGVRAGAVEFTPLQLLSLFLLASFSLCSLQQGFLDWL